MYGFSLEVLERYLSHNLDLDMIRKDFKENWYVREKFLQEVERIPIFIRSLVIEGLAERLDDFGFPDVFMLAEVFSLGYAVDVLGFNRDELESLGITFVPDDEFSIMDTPIYVLDVKIRQIRCIQGAGLETIGAVVNYGVDNVPRLNDEGKKIVKEALRKIGVSVE